MSVPPDFLEWVRLADDDLGTAALLVRQRVVPDGPAHLLLPPGAKRPRLG